jgi:L,D-transpeptidase catalytic domain
MTGDGSAASRRPYCVAVLLAAGLAIGAGSQARAARYYWRDAEPFFDRPFVRHFQRQHSSRHGKTERTEKLEKESGKPQGPLIIAISINQQKLKIYDANGFFAEAPVSTGMHGHPTPMGVFSVIQKHKFHHSNIYSNAPMPYMQRITWSGVAMHAGVLPGYPASHGCIRMPMAFAIKMWNWTKMGARVVVTPGELTPAAFAHALLPTQKVVPQPVAAVEPETDKPVSAGKGAPETGPTNSGASLELRSTVGHPDGVKAATDETALTPRDQTRTADASSNSASSKVTMSDASSGGAAPQREDDAAKPEIKPEGASAGAAEAARHDTARPDDKVVAEGRTAKANETKPATDAKTTEAKASEAKASEAKASEAKASEAKASDAKASDAKASETNTTEVKPQPANSEPAKADAAKPADKPADPAKPASASKDKDQARLPDADKSAETKAAATRADPPKRAGQIAVFISRKDSKLYVRQNFSPLFEVPVTIGPSDRPLGTHVFTADVDKTDSNLLHWSVVTLPVSSRSAMRADDEERPSRRRKNGATAETKPIPLPDSPAEALDRITIPADAMARVSDALTSGGSIIVSDQGINQGDTGEGTDFIVSLH